jgi:hypothetical protein
MAMASTPGSCDAHQIAAAAARPAARARIRGLRSRLKLAAVVSSLLLLLHHMSSCAYTGLMSAHRN